MKNNQEKIPVVILAFVVISMTIILLLIGRHNIRALIRALIDLGYLGAFLVGILGTSSLMISIIPPQIVAFVMGTPDFGFNPFLIGISMGLGAGIGQYLHYYVGASGRFLISEKRKGSIEKWKNRLNRYGPLLIFLFAVTPLTPDDLVWIPLGIMRYPKLKALISAIIGKTVMLIICAYGGYYGIGLIHKYLIRFWG